MSEVLVPGSSSFTAAWALNDSVCFFRGPASNWVILSDSTGCTLIDSGYPADRDRVLDSFRYLGLTPSDCRAILLTHGHTDHCGGAAQFASAAGIAVMCHRDEVANLVGPVRQQVTLETIQHYLSRPTVESWVKKAIGLGGLAATSLVPTSVFDDGQILEVPGSPKALHTGGHTSGHTVFEVHSEGKQILISGDIVVTGHESEFFPPNRLQQLYPIFQHDAKTADRKFQELCQTRAWDVILPGHGPAWVDGAVAG